MILGFEVEQLCLDLDIIYDRLFFNKKKSHIRGIAFYPAWWLRSIVWNVRLSLSYGYLCFNKETT